MRRAKHRSLWPREHGAYVQLLAPMVVALGSSAPGVPAILLATAACVAFLANEPLLVLLGGRGRRMREHDRQRARRRLALLASVAIITGVAGLLASTSATIAVAAATLIPALAVLWLASRGREHTLSGELAAAVALAGLAAPVAVANGTAPPLALALWVAWSLGFASTVIVVHRLLARYRRAATISDVVIGIGLAVLGAVLVIPRDPVGLVAAPFIVLSTALVVRAPRATRLRAVGIAYTLVAGLSAVYAIAQVT